MQDSLMNMVNRNIRLADSLLKLRNVRIRRHKGTSKGMRLKSVTVSKEPPGKITDGYDDVAVKDADMKS